MAPGAALSEGRANAVGVVGDGGVSWASVPSSVAIPVVPSGEEGESGTMATDSTPRARREPADKAGSFLSDWGITWTSRFNPS